LISNVIKEITTPPSRVERKRKSQGPGKSTGRPIENSRDCGAPSFSRFHTRQQVNKSTTQRKSKMSTAVWPPLYTQGNITLPADATLLQSTEQWTTIEKYAFRNSFRVGKGVNSFFFALRPLGLP